MVKRVLLMLAIIIVSAIAVQAADWTIDPAHSTVGFAVRHMVISKVRGEFTDYSGTIAFDGKDLSSGKADIKIKTASINTGNENRDNHLRSSEFLDAAAFPEMTFVSKKITVESDNTFAMVGDLTIRDVTKEVTLQGQFNGIITDPRGNTRAGFSAATTINRQDYNVSWDNKLKDGSLVVGDNVDINLELELVKAPDKS